MPITEDQARALLTKAKAQKPDLTPQEAKSLLAKANSRVDQPQRPAIQKVADFIGLGTTASNIGSLGLIGQADKTQQAGQQSGDAFTQAQALTKQAQSLPRGSAEQKQLLDQARSIMSGSEASMGQFQQGLAQKQQVAGVSEADLGRGQGEFLARRGLGQSAELASFLVPGAAQEVGAANRIVQAAGRGALTGGLQGVAGASRTAETAGQALGQTALGATLGAGMGAALQGIGEVGKKIYPKGTPKEAIDLSERVNETKRAIRAGEATTTDRLRASQFLKYKNKGNDLINENEVARVLDDVKLKYSSTDQLGARANQLATALQDVKVSSLKNQPGKIDVSGASNVFYDNASMSLKSKKDLETIFNGLVRKSSKIQGLKGANPLEADKLASEIGKEASKYYSSWQKTGDPASQHMYEGLKAAKDLIRDQIDTKFADSIAFSPAELAQVSKFSPELAKAIEAKTLGMADINYIQAMLGNAKSLAADTTTALKGAGQQVLGGKGLVNIPILSQVGSVIGQGADVLLSPLQSLARTQTAKLSAGVPNLLQNIGQMGAKGISSVAQSAIKAKPVIPAGVSALQRMIDKENQSKQTNRRLR